jgi:pimeloyl-ACP methyl ester carboxylesterase
LRKYKALRLGSIAAALASILCAQDIAGSLPTQRFIAVDTDVKLEVLDWGGAGRPVVLLTGLGNNAHIYDQFAPKLTTSHHVYAVTRRGFGVSSAPAPTGVNYSADRLGDDVLAVIDSLKLNRPVLVGHSIAGEELSSIGSRHPEKVSGLIYLDAAYSYAYYDRSRGDLLIDAAELRKKLEQIQPGRGPQDFRPLIQELLDKSLPDFEKELRETQKSLQANPPVSATQPARLPPIHQAILAGMQKYTDLSVPILAIFAVPHDDNQADPETEQRAKAFETGISTARVVRLPHANHYVFISNEADVLREIDAFLQTLK